MKFNISQFLALLIAIGVVMLFIFGPERKYLPPIKVVNEYDEVLIKNKKSNRIKKSIISTLELIAYKEWSLDSLILIEKKYESMDSVLIQRLEDIKFEFGYSEMLKKVNEEKGLRLDSTNIKEPNLNIELEKLIIKHELDSLIYALSFHRKSLDTLRSLSRYKFYLKQPRFGQ
jgi:homospermidine synthase|tara:strand:+ start:542 stop:1060 length:519 start_codon:yes stop_codon:yes gene_type:complete